MGIMVSSQDFFHQPYECKRRVETPAQKETNRLGEIEHGEALLRRVHFRLRRTRGRSKKVLKWLACGLQQSSMSEVPPQNPKPLNPETIVLRRSRSFQRIQVPFNGSPIRRWSL